MITILIHERRKLDTTPSPTHGAISNRKVTAYIEVSFLPRLSMNQDNEELTVPVGMITVLSLVDEVALHSSSTTAKISIAKCADNVSSSKATLQVILLPYCHF